MSTSHLQPDTPATDELVAYLDGELSADECRRVERRLASDADYRRQLSELEQAWSALEALPQATVDDDFARTTIEMVAVVGERDATERSATQSTARVRRTYLAAAIGVALAVAAFAAARTLVPGPNDVLMHDLPVIAQLDALMQIEDFEFLQELSKLEIGPAGSGDGPQGAATVPIVSSKELRTPGDRRAWIDGLSPDSKAEMAAKLDRFQSLTPTPEAQERLRMLERDIARADDRVRLQKTLANYAAWIQGRTPGEQLELRELSTSERLRRVEKLLRETGRPLSLEDEKALQDAILEFVADRRTQFLRALERRGNAERQRRIPEHPTAWVALAIIRWDMRDDKRREAVQDRLTARLSPEVQEYFDSLEGRQRSRQLWQWIGNALRPEFGPQDLEQFFTSNELSYDERERLLSLPRADMEAQLQQMYISSQVGLGGGNWDDGFDRPGEFGRSGPPLGLEPRGPGRGPGERGRRDGPRGEFDGRRFDRDGLPPPGGRPPEGHWGPPPHGPGPPPDAAI